MYLTSLLQGVMNHESLCIIEFERFGIYSDTRISLFIGKSSGEILAAFLC